MKKLLGVIITILLIGCIQSFDTLKEEEKEKEISPLYGDTILLCNQDTLEILIPSSDSMVNISIPCDHETTIEVQEISKTDTIRDSFIRVDTILNIDTFSKTDTFYKIDSIINILLKIDTIQINYPKNDSIIYEPFKYQTIELEQPYSTEKLGSFLKGFDSNMVQIWQIEYWDNIIIFNHGVMRGEYKFRSFYSMNDYEVQRYSFLNQNGHYQKTYYFDMNPKEELRIVNWNQKFPNTMLHEVSFKKYPDDTLQIMNFDEKGHTIFPYFKWNDSGIKEAFYN